MASNVLSREFMVKPSECNAAGKLPLTLLVAQMIDVATDHANELGIGFLALEPMGAGWVLSRLSVEMVRWPANGERYKLSTWIESYNAHYSERCFSVVTNEGETLGYGRTIWMIIDLSSHKSLGTAGTIMPAEMIAGLPCPIPRMDRQRTVEFTKETEYEFQYMDIDYYRHVNTVKYIALLLNQFALRDFDENFISRFDIAFAREAKYGERAKIKSMKEPVETPILIGADLPSEKHIFQISTEDRTILNSSFVLSKL